MRYPYVLFDLDGTLTDSAPGIAKCLAAGLEEIGVSISDYHELYPYVGPPLEVTWAGEKPGITEEESLRATKRYRQAYDEFGWLDNEPFAGAMDCLKTLKEAGIIMATASSKPTGFVKKICQYFGLAPYFHHMTGGDLIHNRMEKVQVVEDCLKEFEQPFPLESALLVGDRIYDVEGGHAAGLRVAGVSFGYGGRRELRECKADWIFDSYEELVDFLLEEPLQK